MKTVSVENNNNNKIKSCPDLAIKFTGKNVTLKSIGLYSGCFHYVITTEGDTFIVRPDTLELFKLALVNEFQVWVNQVPADDWFSVRIFNNARKNFF